jgi:Leucine-rich repeat (LRR) protein
MIILVLTLMMSFLNHSAFCADPDSYISEDEELLYPREAEQDHKEEIPETILQKIGTYLRKEVVSTIPPLLKGARETIAQKFFTLNMEHIKEENAANLAALLFDTKDAKNLKIVNLKWKIFKSALEMKPDLKFNNLEQLDLSNNDINDEIVLSINEFLFSRTPNLTKIDLSDNKIGAKGTIAIALISNLITLRLSWNQIGDAGSCSIAKSLHMKSLQSLSLCGNQIKDNGATDIIQSRHMNSLIILHLWGNQIEEGIRARLRQVYRNCKI